MSIFEQGGNEEYLQTFVDPLKLRLTGPNGNGADRTLSLGGRLNIKEVWAWIADTMEFQEHLVKGLLPSIGISPRAFQAACFSYTSGQHFVRCLKIVDNHTILCSPLSKQDGTKQYECFFALPAEIAWFLLFFLGVIRPMVIFLLESPSIHDSSAVEDLRQYLFVTVKKSQRAPYRWSGADIDRCLRDSSLHLDANGLRHVTTGIIRHWFPHLACAYSNQLNQASTSPLDKQGQHSSKVSRMFYARTTYVNSTSFNESEFHSQIRISQAIQKLDDIVENGGRAVRPKNINAVDAITRNGWRAMAVARSFILSRNPGYDIAHAGDQNDIQKRLKVLLEIKPFLRGPDAKAPEGNWVPSWETLGDVGLIWVTAAMAQSYILEGPSTESLQIGYSPKFVAYAVYLLTCALDEWEEGVFNEVDWEADPKRAAVVQEIEHAILTFRANHIEKWIEFRGEVDSQIRNRTLHKKPPTFSEKPYFNSGLFPELMDSDEEEKSKEMSRPLVNLEEIHAQEIQKRLQDNQAHDELQLVAQRKSAERKEKRKKEKERKKGKKKNERLEKENEIEVRSDRKRTKVESGKRKPRAEGRILGRPFFQD
ncbi:hypothetical protein F5890DRAFT_1558706 [Lentinula detonsa]|uniref:Uncharacterized protein n=1 Tax=Lentinula detonsa TaxID=2804962 RepID=A0AA38PPM8_9AGAR|nr:hypothetical protein F5890DRAFT_1558706 [Lentinula detonsa]